MPLRVETSPNQFTEYEIFSANLINEFGRELFGFLNSTNVEPKNPATAANETTTAENQTTTEENQATTQPNQGTTESNQSASADRHQPVLKHPSDLCQPLHQQSQYYYVSKEVLKNIKEQCSSHDSTFPYTPPEANQTTTRSTDKDEQITTSTLDWPSSKFNETGTTLRSQIVTIVQCRSNPTSGLLNSDQNRSKSRRAVRLLIHLQNQQQRQMEAFLDTINEALLLEPDTVKTIWDSNGEQITNPADLLRRGRLYFASSEENVNLDQLEITDDELASINRFEIVRQQLSQSAHLVSKPTRGDQTRTPSRKSTPFNMDERRSATVQAQAIAYNDPNTFPDVFLRHYEVGDIIGDGRFSAVFECRDRATGITLALKIIDKTRCQGFEYLIENELAILRRVKHPNIIKLVEEFQNEQKYFLIFEYVPGGDLFTAISTMNKYSEYDVALMISQMAMALKHLHSLDIVHRDVKLDNILISTYPDQSVTLKLADFGLALCFTDQTPRQVAAQGESLCGTPMYMAPEVIEYGDYRIENDIWSLGIITFTLLSGMAPYNGENEQEILQNVTKVPIDYSLLPKVSADCRNALMAMLDRDPRNRISASELLQHPWIQNALERRKEALKDAAHPRRRRKAPTRQQPLLTFSSVENPHALPISNLRTSTGDSDDL